MENLDLDDKEMEMRTELERINKTLTLPAIRKHEPYKCLPYQYLPLKEFDHRPPLFMYGLALEFEEINEYILRPDTPIPPEMLHGDGMDLLCTFVKHLRTVFGLPNAVLPWYITSRDGRLVFQMMTNYDRRGITEEDAARVIAVCERLFPRPPLWYLSSMMELKEDYRIPVHLSHQVFSTFPSCHNLGNLGLDDEDTSPDAIRAELERTNKAPKISAIRRHEPYELLPYQYLPMKELDHWPPLFMYGLALDLDEIDQYIIRPDTPISPEMVQRSSGPPPIVKLDTISKLQGGRTDGYSLY
ncbi:hypothetical protein BD779DRAFT_1803808 [Infundibulicybe gibba]|nr:hypothetical protein BD779DRAFT_1803808 [Infundibulicybe gibba]